METEAVEKLEIRSSKSATNLKFEFSNVQSYFGHLDFGYLILFRASNFGIRI